MRTGLLFIINIGINSRTVTAFHWNTLLAVAYFIIIVLHNYDSDTDEEAKHFVPILSLKCISITVMYRM